jgi:glutamine cyclotransferase
MAIIRPSRYRVMHLRIFALIAPLLALGAAPPQPPATPIATAEIVARFPHDPKAFTEGLLIDHGSLYESTGREGSSTIRRIDLETGAVRQSVSLPNGVFGEGIVIWRDQLLNVIWHGGMGERRSLHSFKTIGRFRYSGEGWALTQDGTHIILSDGTPVLRFLDPVTMKVTRRLTVTYQGKPLARINELEYVKGDILANVWLTPFIVRIDAQSGAVTQVIDLSDIVADAGVHDADAVANGIAYDTARDRLYVTGKLWPNLYEIRLKPVVPDQSPPGG